jgi:hypothetical protein
MKKPAVMLPNSSFKRLMSSSASLLKQPIKPTFAYTMYRFQNGKLMGSLSLLAQQHSAFRNNRPLAMKYLLPLFVGIAISPTLLRAQVVVTNPISDAFAQVMHAEDLAKQVEVINNQVQQINALTQQLQQVQAYVKAFGNPEQVRNVVGADQLVTSLQQTGVGQTLSTLQQKSDGADSLSYTGNGIYETLASTFTTPAGVEITRTEDSYRKFGAIQQSSQNFQAVTNNVLSRRESLRQAIAATTQQLQFASTDAETQKLSGVLAGYTAELAAVDREVDHAADQVTTQDIENRADRERQEQARREERQAQVEEGFRRYSEVFHLDTSVPAFPGGH